MLGLAILSFIAGFLTILAPCILPLLPVIVGSSGSSNRQLRPLVIVSSLGLTIIILTVFVKGTALATCLPNNTWKWVSVVIFLLFALTLLFPSLWDRWSFTAKFNAAAQKWLNQGYRKHSFWGDVILGAALTPVFTSCSPTYVALIAIIITQDIPMSVLYLIVYLIGLMVAFLLVAFIGQKIIRSFQVLANPQGIFRKILGIVFLITALLFAFDLPEKLKVHMTDPLNVTAIEQKLGRWLDVKW